jgi:hypothetical protein
VGAVCYTCPMNTQKTASKKLPPAVRAMFVAWGKMGGTKPGPAASEAQRKAWVTRRRHNREAKAAAARGVQRDLPGIGGTDAR